MSSDLIDEDYKLSSVVIPIFKDTNGDLSLILTKRSETLKNHAGQISFPGGMYSESDRSLEETGLREWEEETGEPKEFIKILGKYSEIKTRTGYQIVSYVGVYSGNFQFDLSEEVEYLFTVKFSEFFNLPFYTIEYKPHPPGFIYYFQHDVGLIWGATCEIILQFLKDFLGFQRTPQQVKPNISTPPFFIPTGKKFYSDLKNRDNIYFRDF
ncbi:MAG: CoA pyrophosphatase [Leptospiraceae bacterium]|nr:CoA pyrophosphatase [Leptospiraceae bacterium]